MILRLGASDIRVFNYPFTQCHRYLRGPREQTQGCRVNATAHCSQEPMFMSYLPIDVAESSFDPDATSIYDISSTPYDVDCIDPYHDALIVHPLSDEDRLDPDATSIIDIRGTGFDVDDLDTTAICIRALPRGPHAESHRRLILSARQDIAGLRAALASGWDVGPELLYEERRLASLEAAT